MVPAAHHCLNWHWHQWCVCSGSVQTVVFVLHHEPVEHERAERGRLPNGWPVPSSRCDRTSTTTPGSRPTPSPVCGPASFAIPDGVHCRDELLSVPLGWPPANPGRSASGWKASSQTRSGAPPCATTCWRTCCPTPSSPMPSMWTATWTRARATPECPSGWAVWSGRPADPPGYQPGTRTSGRPMRGFPQTASATFPV